MQIDVLGTKYAVEVTEDTGDESNDGICDFISRTIKVWPDAKICPDHSKDLQRVAGRNTMRHEVIHAFLYESGLTDYTCDETLVEALAILCPKINAGMMACDAL